MKGASSLVLTDVGHLASLVSTGNKSEAAEVFFIVRKSGELNINQRCLCPTHLQSIKELKLL